MGNFFMDRCFMTKNKSKKLKIFIPVICFLIITGVLCGFILPRVFTKNIVQNNLCQGEQKYYDFNNDFKPFVQTSTSALYVNEKTSAIVITNKNNGVVFNSHSKAAAENKLATIFSLTLRDEKGNLYIKNSSINGVEYGKFEITEKKKNSVTITFYLADNEKGEISETIPVKFSGKNGGIKVEIDTNNIILKDGFCIEKISILPGVFSENNPIGNCFYTVPDGCGAQIDLTAKAEKSYSQTLDVYGSDITFGEYSRGASLPCFAMTKNQVMLTTIIDDGDALSSIYVKHNKNKGGCLYNTFIITPYAKVNNKLVKGVSYDGIISQVYYLSIDGDKDYNEVSSIVRDNLTEKGYLPSKMSDTFVDYPFFVTAIGSENGKKNTLYTSFENSAEMIALLKSRGVRCIALRFAGAGDKGLNSGAAGCDDLSNNLGGYKEYSALCDLATEKNSSVWYDANFAVTPDKNGKSETTLYSDLRAYLSKEKINSRIGSYNYTYSNISDVYKFISEIESGNVCVNDLSSYLYTDILGGVNRQTALDNLSDKIESLSVGGGLMLSAPAVYLMKQADAVFSVPQNSTLEENAGVTVVPLLQMVLHGSVCYGSEPVNLFENSEDAVLKAVEYGASPSFVFTYDNCDVLDYGVYATQTAKFYSSVKRMLPLLDMKMTSHEQVVSGVYKITYDYSKIVYVNYNPSVVEVNGILVSAKDFVVI